MDIFGNTIWDTSSILFSKLLTIVFKKCQQMGLLIVIIFRLIALLTFFKYKSTYMDKAINILIDKIQGTMCPSFLLLRRAGVCHGSPDMGPLAPYQIWLEHSLIA